MKLLVLLSVLYLTGILVEGLDEEEFVRVLIPLKSKYFGWQENKIHGSAIAPNEHHRIIRQAKTCQLPSSMENSELECKLYPSKVICTQTCMFGHTLSDGIQREMKCIYDEDKWTPSREFEKCEPFVDCTLNISSGGKYKCHVNFMDKGPSCDVSCQRYEDKPEVPTKTYECDINGNWSPKLPFCVTAGTGVKLVSNPKGHKRVSKN